jgi:polysaccharide biosynthesis transport protein
LVSTGLRYSLDLSKEMLQYRAPLVQLEESEPAHDVPLPNEPSLADHLATAIGFIRRQFPVIVSVLPLTVGLAVAYLLTTPPRYTAEARILVDTGKVQVSNQPAFGDSPVTMAIVDSQIEILRSDNFALSIIKNLNLTQDPEFVGSQGLFANAISRLLHPLGSSSPSTQAALEQRALTVFEKRLTVSRLGMTYVIEVEYQSTSPDRAAEIANAVADKFIRDQMDAKYQTLGKATAWLEDRLNELRTQASAAEHAVVEYKAKHNIVDTGGHLINEQQLSELNTALIKARADTAEAKARLDRISQIINSDDLDPATTQVATVADALHNEVISKLRQQYLELAQREAILSNRIGHDHLAVINIRNQMRENRRSIFDEFKRIAEAYKSEYDIAKARENSLQASLATTVTGSQTANSAQVELRQLESAAQSYRALFNNFQQRYTDFVQQQSFPISEAQITRALPPAASSSPKAFRILAMAAAGGLALGFALAFLREISDRVFRTSDQIEARLRTGCVAMLPLVTSDVSEGPQSKRNAAGSNQGARKILLPNGHMLRHVVDSPLSEFSEAIRAVKVTVDLGAGSKSNKVVGITSSLPDEGKSSVSASLAQLCAHSGARVILVDCDLRRRSLSQQLAPNANSGIIDVITESANLDEVIWSDPSTKLSFLPVVAKSRLAHTSEILASAAMKRLFGRLRERYDYVIVDLSPLAPVVDVRAAPHLVDSYLFVVEWGKTKIDVVERALNSARGVYDNLLGVVLNKVDFAVLGRYDYGAYYTRYGYYKE